VPTLASSQCSEKQESLAAKETGSGLIAICMCSAVLCGFVAANDRCLHWSLLPLFCCGVLIGTDAVDWVRGRVDLFDPVGVLGVLGFHFFFLAPLLHVTWDHWALKQVPPPDWRFWLGAMAVLNALALLVYRFARGLIPPSSPDPSDPRRWVLATERCLPILAVALVGTAILQVAVYASYGGIVGYMELATSTDRRDAMRGMGWISMISESFPILAMILYVVYAVRNPSYRSQRAVAIALLVFFVLLILFGGLRGSRSNTIWGLFWACGIVHFWVRPISRKIALSGALFVCVFMYFYGFYKDAGLDALDALQSAEARQALEHKTGRNLEGLLLEDLGRADIQAYVLYRVMAPESDYELGWGRTYLGAFSLLIPRSLWPDRPPTKVKEGTEVLDRKGTYAPLVWESSRVYGLAGEAMLNFGPLAVFPAFFLLGSLVGRVQQLMLRLQPSDSRLLTIPFLVNLCFIILVGDSDNILFAFFKSLAMPLGIIYLCSVWHADVAKEEGTLPRCVPSRASQ